MKSKSTRYALFVCAILGLLAVGGVLQAAPSGFMVNFGSVIYQAESPLQLRRFPTLEGTVPVPTLVNPIAQGVISVLCRVHVHKNAQPVERAKGNFTGTLLALDHSKGTFANFKIAKVKFRTDQDGVGYVDYEIPTALFGAGFESGDVSIWLYNRADFAGSKKSDQALMLCNLYSSE